MLINNFEQYFQKGEKSNKSQEKNCKSPNEKDKVELDKALKSSLELGKSNF